MPKKMIRGEDVQGEIVIWEKSDGDGGECIFSYKGKYHEEIDHNKVRHIYLHDDISSND